MRCYLPKPLARLCLAAAGLLTVTSGSAQVRNPYEYSALSHLALGTVRDSLKKNWKVPDQYKDKETQKKYKEIWDGRTDYVVGAIENKDFIVERDIYNYVDAIITQLQSANKDKIPRKPMVLIDRSANVNAYSMGGHLIAVNLGLVAFSQNREELALVLAHELAHDALEHADRSMRERAEWLTSAEYKKSLNEVLDSRYERYTRLKKVMETYTFSRTRHNRYHESEADSMAVVFLRNSKIAFEPGVFLRLDSVDRQYQQPLARALGSYFTDMGLTIDEAWTQRRTKGLSARNYSFSKGEEMADSLKTHPDCQERYNRTKQWATASGALTPIPAAITDKSNRIIIWNLFDNQSLTACLYRILLEKDRGASDDWYAFMLHNVFFGLNYADNNLSRFNAIKILPKEYVSASYFSLQTMLEQIPRENLAQFSKHLAQQPFWQNLPADARALKPLYNLMLDKEASEKARITAAKAFTSSHPASMYCEFADHFAK
ncbi:peptidase M48 Ste24p [Flaviaesturariibacter flavus]|uniref:Peptidase M48 Ste24p n=1 Tax=Flaviaesturariibacter flavus TaxID=2502780 RepID=A0A4V2NVN8_9BACT|nr:M48 family metalloprotease [Flaviaesturariibacter flavus]TCJ14212.1 peptidase M48 Ste24p [Flaviaesturariibacter flavus]